MFKWMAAFIVVAIVFGFLSVTLGSPAAQTIAIVSFIFGLLLMVSALFEKTASV